MGLYENTENGLKLLAGSTLYADAPIGAIQAFGGATAPSGWFICDGSAKSRTDFAELFAVIGTAFGTGDGSTTFNLPDMRESVPKGAGLTGHTVGAHVKSGGLAVGEFLDDRIQNHAHHMGSAYNTQNGSQNAYAFTSGEGSTTGSVKTGRNGATTEVKSVGVNYIIKAKQVGLPLDIVEQVKKSKKLANPIPAVQTNNFTASYDGFVCLRTSSAPAGGNGKISVDVYRDGTKITDFFFVYLNGYGSSCTYPCNQGDNFKINTTIDCVMIPYES